MKQQLSPTPSFAAQQLQGILVELADIEQRLRRVNLAVASIASELAPTGQAEAALPADDEQARVRAALARPRSAAVVHTLAQANQRAQQLAELTPSELQVLLADSRQQAQADAIARGEAIDEEWEAALGD